jgi:hypothetical protein
VEQRAANAMTEVRRQDREREFGKFVCKRDMGYSDESKGIVMDGEHCTAVEIDFVDIGGDAFAS